MGESDPISTLKYLKETTWELQALMVRVLHNLVTARWWGPHLVTLVCWFNMMDLLCKGERSFRVSGTLKFKYDIYVKGLLFEASWTLGWLPTANLVNDTISYTRTPFTCRLNHPPPFPARPSSSSLHKRASLICVLIGLDVFNGPFVTRWLSNQLIAERSGCVLSKKIILDFFLVGQTDSFI